ncbi:putative SMP-30/Gluconolactonase/LRE-like region domain-containing protein [Seiridium cardinale]
MQSGSFPPTIEQYALVRFDRPSLSDMLLEECCNMLGIVPHEEEWFPGGLFDSDNRLLFSYMVSPAHGVFVVRDADLADPDYPAARYTQMRLYQMIATEYSAYGEIDTLHCVMFYRVENWPAEVSINREIEKQTANNGSWSVGSMVAAYLPLDSENAQKWENPLLASVHKLVLNSNKAVQSVILFRHPAFQSLTEVYCKSTARSVFLRMGKTAPQICNDLPRARYKKLGTTLKQSTMRSSITLAIAATVTSCLAAMTLQVWNFTDIITIENSALRRNGRLLLTTFTNASLYTQGTLVPNSKAQLVEELPGAGRSILGNNRPTDNIIIT